MRRILAAVCCLLIAGCTTDSSPGTATPAPSPAPSPSPLCPTSAEITAGELGLEREGTGDGATLWALFFGNRPIVGQEIKIVWRMTGSGALTMSATGENGASTMPVWGPEEHSGSSYRRPGEEWGTGWVFPAAGCWTVHAVRTAGTAQLAVRVAEK